MTPAISVSGLVKNFGTTPALDQLDLTVVETVRPVDGLAGLAAVHDVSRDGSRILALPT